VLHQANNNHGILAKGSRILVVLLALVAVIVAALTVAPAKGGRLGGCRVQSPQRFLKRSSYVRNGMLDGRAHDRAVEYRAKRYGSVPGMGLERFNARRVADQVVQTTFFGHALTIHERVAPALACVEKRIEASCTKPSERYTPRHIGGLRTENTIRGGEISNHLFGIAVDIDPEQNPCCHCVIKWQKNPRCKNKGHSPYDRADIPRCWVEAFERYGFYWLGNDALEDTMHFEFLGEPAHSSSGKAGK
jgi:hypothetical protein